MGRWAENSFWANLINRLTTQDAMTSQRGLAYDEAVDGWRQNRSPGLACMPVLLQGQRLAADVTDRGLSLLPIGLGGRFDLDVGFRIADRSTGHADATLVTRPGAAELHGPGWKLATQVAVHAPLVVVTVQLPHRATVTPYLRWVPGERDGTFLLPASFRQDSGVERNNSTIPDPLPAADRPTAGVEILYGGEPVGERVLPEPTILASRRYPGGTVQELVLPPSTGTELRIVLGVGTGPDEIRAWEMEDAELSYWERTLPRLRANVPDRAITRQLPYSVHNSLFSRSVTTAGRQIFVHGRRDRGYADASHLHQSYQMHLPALAAGEGASVRSELLAYAELQREDGWIEAAPRPGTGSSRYVGRYTSAHLLLAVHRYLAWTGDTGLLEESIKSAFDPVPRRMAERVERAAADLVNSRVAGLLPPCGWADAWNPRVRAQGQISAATVLAFDAWSDVCRHLGDEPAGRRWSAAARDLAAQIRTTLLDAKTGLVAEHLFDEGVAGGTPDDFWTPTQIWAALAGITSDRRGLDLVREACLATGLAVVPESSFERAYVAESTDSTDALPVESTATWLLARWPELTHLYALAEIDAGRPDAALAAVREQLPERLHELDPACAPYYYAEKYLHPGTRPWLCTWAGDPSLVEVVLTGFLGVKPGLEGLRIQPSVPSTWRDERAFTRFVWRDATYELHLEPGGDPTTLLVDGVSQPATSPISPHVGLRGEIHRLHTGT